MTFHDRKWKEKTREEIKGLAQEYPVVAIATLEELPANIMSLLRKRLSGEAKIVVAKTRVIQKAFEEADIDSSKLNPFVKESIALIFSKKNPFELFSFVKKNKGNATAKPGDIAISDIVIQAGDTGLPPGPALSSLKAVGLKVKVAGPTIEVSEDKTVAKKGEEVAPEVADVLGKLNLKPMKIGMKILAVLDKNENEIYAADVLDVDEEELFDNFVQAYQQALNLSVNAEIFNDASTELIVIKAEREAKAVEGAIEEASGEEAKEDGSGGKKEETQEPEESQQPEGAKEAQPGEGIESEESKKEDSQKEESKEEGTQKEEPKKEETQNNASAAASFGEEKSEEKPEEKSSEQAEEKQEETQPKEEAKEGENEAEKENAQEEALMGEAEEGSKEEAPKEEGVKEKKESSGEESAKEEALMQEAEKEEPGEDKKKEDSN